MSTENGARIKSFDLVNPVMHRGSMVTQIAGAYGDELYMAHTGLFVNVIPNPTSNKEPYSVPMSNVKKVVFYNEAVEAKKVEVAKVEAAKVEEAKAEEKKQPRLLGVEKLYKDKDGTIKSKII